VSFNSRMSGGLGVLLLCIASRSLAADAPAKPAPGKEPETVVIGMPKSLFQGIPQFLIKAGSGPFLQLMKDSTGIEGKLSLQPDAMTQAREMNEGKVQLGVFLGQEFAWVKEKYPDLVPIAIAVPNQPVQAYCVVLWNCPAKSIRDLKKQTLALPPVHRDFCEMFLAKQKDLHMKGAAFAGQIVSASGLDALHDVIAEKAGCTIVDATTLKHFEDLYPGQFKNLKVLCQSEVFPNACIAVKKDELNAKTIEKFRKALMTAQDKRDGRYLLESWKLKGFSKVPDDYELQLKAVKKAYFPPADIRAAVNK
jgi:ABC-type phosphate/phosphonate transport system substrate-binding protein